MASISLNLKSVYSEKIHVPTMANKENKSPLYALKENVNDPEIGNLNRDDSWMEASATTYNSPTNVRRLVLTDSWVVTEFYTPFIIKGSPSKDGKWRVRKVPGDVVKAKKFILTGGSGGDLAYGASSESYNITGNMLSPIRQWVLSNIEEIILDETCFFSSNVNDNKIGIPKLICRDRSFKAFNQQQKNWLFSQLLKTNDLSSLTKQFPRLKVIAIIPDLSKLVTTDELTTLKSKMSGTLYDVLVDNGKVTESDCIVKRLLPKDIVDLGELRVRTYYKFDAEVLHGYAKKFAASLSSEREEDRKRKAAEEKARVEASKSDLEKTLEAIEASSNLNQAKAVLLLTVSGLNGEDRKKLKDSFTKDGLRFW